MEPKNWSLESREIRIMAQGKKSFLLYADIIHTVKMLSAEHAGELFLHILRYVNDEEPEAENAVVKIAFEPIKQQLKRDLKRWEEIKEAKSKAGKASALARKKSRRKQKQHPLTPVNTSQQSSTDLTVIDNVNVNVNDNVSSLQEEYTEAKPPIFVFKTALVEQGVSEDLAKEWIKVRKQRHAVNTKTAFAGFKTQVEKSGKTMHEIVQLCVENSWRGFKAEWVNANIDTKKPQVLRYNDEKVQAGKQNTIKPPANG